MTSVLPIVDRELRVRSRWPITYRIRLVAAGLEILLLIVFLTVYRGQSMVQSGQFLFQLLSVVTLLFCFFEGLRNTSDCISEEAREGTLGLLFLTPLRGFDVVMGKLVAAALNSVYGLIAVLPIVALPILAGGVTFGEFARCCLVFINALFLSLTIGLWISTRVRDQQRTVLVSMMFMLLIVGGLPLLEVVWHGMGAWTRNAFFSLCSPAFGLYLSSDVLYRANTASFWSCVVSVQALGWGLVLLSSVQIRKAYLTGRIDKTHGLVPMKSRSVSERAGRRFLFESDPFFWVCSLTRHSKLWIWGVTLGLSILPLGIGLLARGTGPQTVGVFSLVFGLLCHLGFHFGIFTLTCQAITELKKSGLLEIMLTTPLSIQNILIDHWRYVAGLLTVPIGLIVVGRLLVWLSLVWSSSLGGQSYPAMVHMSLYLLNFITGILALIWGGFWFSLSSNHFFQAMGKAFVITQFLPWLASFVITRLITPLIRDWWIGDFNMPYMLITILPPLLIDILIILWALKRLFKDFRLVASGQGATKFTVPSWRTVLDKIRSFGR